MKKIIYFIIAIFFFSVLSVSIDRAYAQAPMDTSPNVFITVKYSNGPLVLTRRSECWVYIWEVERRKPMLTFVTKGRTVDGVYSTRLPDGNYIALAQKTLTGEILGPLVAYTPKPDAFSIVSGGKYSSPHRGILTLNIPMGADAGEADWGR